MGGGGGISGRVRALNLTVPLGSGQTISGTGRVRASVLSPCRPLDPSHDPRSKDDFQGKRRRPGKFAVYVQSDSGLDRTEVCCC